MRENQRGQASVEYVGLIAVLALLAAAFVVALPATAALGLARTVCDAAGFCDGEPGAGTPPMTREESFEAVLALPLEEFLALREAPDRDRRLDWSTDGCSAPVLGDSGATYDFADPCLRHDFAYRNAELLGRFEELRRAADERFHADMDAHCDARLFSRIDCRRWSDIYFAAVRGFGGVGRGD